MFTYATTRSIIFLYKIIMHAWRNHVLHCGYTITIAFLCCQTVYKLRRVKDTPNFISSGSKIVKRLRRRQYDPLIIEMTIGLVLGPCTTLCRFFLKHCTLTNKAVGTIWRALSKPLQRRQGPDLRPLWLLVGTPSAIRPELAFSRAEHSLPYSDVTIYIFLLYYIYHLCLTCNNFYDLSAWGGCWFVVYIRRFIYKFLNVCTFD